MKQVLVSWGPERGLPEGWGVRSEGVTGGLSHSGPSVSQCSWEDISEAGTPSVEERILACFLNSGLI